MIGRGFWQKRYLSKHSGREIDAAVGAAQQLPILTGEDAGKVLIIDEEGNIIPGAGIYSHNITISVDDIVIAINILSERAEAYTLSDFISWLKVSGQLSSNRYYFYTASNMIISGGNSTQITFNVYKDLSVAVTGSNLTVNRTPFTLDFSSGQISTGTVSQVSVGSGMFRDRVIVRVL